jgi:hypothetical protein
MSVQELSPVNQIAQTPEHIWGMALYSFMTATEAVCDLARAQPYRDMAVDDLEKITGAALAVNLMWSQLKAREAA